MENENRDDGFGAENREQYGQYGYGQSNYGMGAAPVDQNGKPLKNRFGMKITFSILEILCCCGCNPITLIMGILGCVFTAQANTAYKEARWEEFRSKAKMSSIFLWIGLGAIVVYLLIGILSFAAVGGSNAVMTEVWDVYRDEMDGYRTPEGEAEYLFRDDELIVEPVKPKENTDVLPKEADYENEDARLDVIAGEEFADPSVAIEGITVLLPLGYQELETLGFYIDDADRDYVLNKGEYDTLDLYSPAGDLIGAVHIGNQTEDTQTLAEGTVFGFCFTGMDFANGVSVSLANGITEQATDADFRKAYGEPDYEYASENEDYQSCQWYNHSEEYYDMSENSLTVDFREGELDEIDLMYIGWE